MFTKYPLGVMKADFWRYCVMFVEGGIYSDLDTEIFVPINKWPIQKEAKIVIGIENELMFCQWTLMA